MNNTSIFDFHVHTRFSDGAPDQSPKTVCRQAVLAGIEHLSITDHDHMLPDSIRKSLANFYDIDLIAGCEVSCLWIYPGTTREVLVHLGGHWLPADDPAMQDILKHNQSQDYEGYVKEMLYRCQKLGLDPYHEGIDRSYERIKDANPHSKHLGKRAVAQILVTSGCVETSQKAYSLLAHGGPAHVNPLKFLRFVSFEEAALTITKHSLCTLNHLYYSRLDDAGNQALLRDFKKLGGHALEVLYPRYNQTQQAKLLRACEEYDLLPNAGSDRHDISKSFLPGPDWMFQQLKDRQLELHGTLNE